MLYWLIYTPIPIPIPIPLIPPAADFRENLLPAGGGGGEGKHGLCYAMLYVAVVCTQRRNIRAIKVPRRGRGNIRKDRRDMGKMSCRYCPEAASPAIGEKQGCSNTQNACFIPLSSGSPRPPHCDCGCGGVVVGKMHHRSLISRSAAAAAKRKSRPNFPGRRQRKLGSHYIYFELYAHMYELGCSTCDACFWVYTLHARIENEDGDKKKRMRRRPSLSSFPLLTFPPSK